MPPRLFSLLALSLLCGALLLGCDEGENDRIAKDVTFRNEVNNTQAIHILGPNEDFSPSNRLMPGQERIFSHETVLGVPVNFRAGRMEQVIANCSADWPYVTVVRWSENGDVLSC